MKTDTQFLPQAILNRVFNSVGRWLRVNIVGEVSGDNSTSTTLSAGATFTGKKIDITNCGAVFVNVSSDQASATDGLSIQQSSDGVNWDHTDDYTVPAGGNKNYAINPHASWLRVVYTNGGSDQTHFRLQTICKGNSIPSSHRIQDSISDDDDARLVKSVLTGKSNGTFVNVRTTIDGDLKISDNSSGLSIAKGDVTGISFIHKFGLAPDFDQTDGEVTIWDGANDGLLGGGAMDYIYSSTADIGTISSSDNGDTQDIEIQGLDSNYAIVTQTVTLTGQTDASLSTNLIRVFRMKNVGTTSLAGVVYLRTNGSGQASGVPSTANTVRSIINDGNNQTLMAVYTVPAGYTGYLRDWYAAIAGANKTSNYPIKLFARPFGQVFQLKHTSAISDNGSSHVQHMYNEPEVFTEKTDIEMHVSASAAGATAASVAAGFDIVLVQN